MEHRTKLNITLSPATSERLSRVSALTGETPEELVEAALTRFLDVLEEENDDTRHEDERHEPEPLPDNKPPEDIVSERVLLAGLEAEEIHRRVHERARREGLARECLRDLLRGEVK